MILLDADKKFKNDQYHNKVNEVYIYTMLEFQSSLNKNRCEI